MANNTHPRSSSSVGFRLGRRIARAKFAAPVGSLIAPGAPRPAAPVTATMSQTKPQMSGANSGAVSGAPQAPLGATAMTAASTAPALASQTSPVLQTGIAPQASVPSAAIAGQTALQGASQSVATHGSGR